MRAPTLLLLAAAACCLLAAAVPARADGISITPCRFNNDTEVCDVSPGYVVATYAPAVDPSNQFSALMMQSFALEVACNQLVTEDTCAANANCTFDDTQDPVCRSTWDLAASDEFARAQLCNGSLAATSIICNAAGQDACASAGNCTWQDGECQSNDVLGMTPEQLVDFGDRFTNFDQAIWGDCPNTKAYIAYVTACGFGAGMLEVNETSCTAYGDACEWRDGSCLTTTVALLRAVFNASAAQSATAAQCAAVTDAAACALAGTPLTLDPTMIDSAAAGNFTSAPELLQLNDTLLNTTGNMTKTGGAGAARAAGGALAAAALLALVLA